jgi:hypothetical protein
MAQSSFITQQYSFNKFIESCGVILLDLSEPQAKKVCLVNLLHKDQ